MTSKKYRKIKTTFKSPKCNNCKKEAPIPITTQAGIFCSTKCEQARTNEFVIIYQKELNDKLAKGTISLKQYNILKRYMVGGPDYQEIETKAKQFLERVIEENKSHIFRMNEGYVVEGKNNIYFVDDVCDTFIMRKEFFQKICVVTKEDFGHLHIYDHIASRILALINDDKWGK